MGKSTRIDISYITPLDLRGNSPNRCDRYPNFTDDLQAVFTAASKLSTISKALAADAVASKMRAPKTRLCSSSSLALCNAASSRARLRSRWIALPTQSAILTQLVQMDCGVSPRDSRQTNNSPKLSFGKMGNNVGCLYTNFCLSERFKHFLKQTANALTPTKQLIPLLKFLVASFYVRMRNLWYCMR